MAGASSAPGRRATATGAGTAPPRCSAMLWLALCPTRLALDALPLENHDGVAVMARHGSRRWVVASKAGVFPGATVEAVLSARPELRLVDSDRHAERTALEALAAIGHRLGSPVHLEHLPATPGRPAGQATVWVEVGRSLRLFGGLDGLLAEAREQLQSQSLHCQLGVAPTLAAAALAARLGAPHRFTDTASLHDWLPGVPVHALDLPDTGRETLQACGMHRLGQLLAVPRDQITRRFGFDLLQQLDRLGGAAPESRPRHRLPRAFEHRQRFDGPIHRIEGLLFPLRRAFSQLALYLRARDTASRSLRLRLQHDDHPETVLPLPLAAPARDGGYWLLLARERLGRLRLPGPVTALLVEADDFAPLQAPQLDLFDTARAAEDAWRQSVERLIARLGEEAVWQLASADDHRPERAWQRLPAHAGTLAAATPAPRQKARRQTPAGSAAGQPQPADPACAVAAREGQAGSAPNRPLWLLDPPRPLPRPPRLHGPPERIEAGWWDGTDTARDYFIGEGEDGRRLWVFREPPGDSPDAQPESPRKGQWFLHGLWA